MTRSIPPGVQLQAECEPPGLPARQLRILGDDARGYLIAGLADMVDDNDFCPTLDEALARAQRAGVERGTWNDITDVARRAWCENPGGAYP